MKDLSQLKEDCNNYIKHLQMLRDFVKERDSVYFEEDFRVPEECEYLVKRIPLENPISRIFHKNLTNISKDDIIKAIKYKRITELYNSGSLGVEYFDKILPTWESDRFFTIDIIKTVGKILGVDDKALYILPNDRYYNLKLDTMKLTARPRVLVDTKGDICNPVKIVTWDLTPTENKEV